MTNHGQYNHTWRLIPENYEVDAQRVPYPTKIPGDYVICALEYLAKSRSKGLDSRTPGPTYSSVISTKGRGRQERSITWIEEDAPEFLRRRSIFCYREACIPGRAVMIVHRNLEVPALKVRIHRTNPEALTIAPRNLGEFQRG